MLMTPTLLFTHSSLACISNTFNNFRLRLIDAQEEWEKLFTQLADNLFWVEAQSKAILEEQPVGGSLSRVQEQTNFVQVTYSLLWLKR